ncbi:hypothetical protein [Microbispora sp. CA-102843]|uniref:hypothetical protein n=1 Tax=Microbispora sp. CA-102843 TaxID=3239952 RepID=UPI003D90CCBB
MAIPALYDIEETARLTRRSKSWLYHQAGVTIPVTQSTPGGRLFWTEEQITEIIRGFAVAPKARAPRTSTPRRTSVLAPAPELGAGLQIPRARPEARRKRRPA